MDRRGLLVATFASAIIVGQGCSSASGPSAGDACASYVSALRDAAKECGRFDVSPSREPDYVARLQRACESALAAPGNGIAPSVLDQCAAIIRAQCGTEDACKELLADVRGSLGEDAACGDDTQCASGKCRRDFSQVSSSCGRCAPTKPIGESCGEGGCVAGATCVHVLPAGEPNAEGTCAAVRTAGEGESCGALSATEAVRCAGDLYCRIDEAGSSIGRCTAPVGEGEDCGIASGHARCQARLSCVNERCSRRPGAGEPCAESGECASGLGCDETKVCVPIVWGPTGAACDDDLRRCDRGFCAPSTANPSKSTCIDYLADGQPCDESKELEQRCDLGARCLYGRCQLEDAALCE